MKQFRVTIPPEEYDKLIVTWKWCLPMEKRYKKLIPEKAVLVGQKEAVLAEGPTQIKFRRRGSLKTMVRDIRVRMLVQEEVDGGETETYLKLYLK